MSNILEESKPIYIDLHSPTLKVHATEGCSIRTLRLDDVLLVITCQT
jgi:hypothetical protein